MNIHIRRDTPCSECRNFKWFDSFRIKKEGFCDGGEHCDEVLKATDENPECQDFDPVEVNVQSKWEPDYYQEAKDKRLEDEWDREHKELEK